MSPADCLRRTSRRIRLAVLPLLVLPGCRTAPDVVPSDADRVLARHTIDAPDPGEPGPWEVGALSYGSGSDRRRAVFRDSVAWVVPTVDASKLIDLGDSEEERNEYWGFGPEAFPLNARVWYPEGEGRFPLVLIVHGNHDPRDFSDPGYEYLGRLLASRGYIAASVDMNFVNGGIREENDARGWLLLQHLTAWRRFSSEPENPFHGRVDLDRIALIGHSRGGEAVVHAAGFNRLSRYPDDASLTFDFGFGIRSIIAIAPVDGQYLPTERFAPVENVNYLVFHGSHDGDVSSFHGTRPYERLRFTDGRPWFKTAVYVYRANHGQWNTVWGAHDAGRRSARILDLRPLLPPEEQRRFAEVYVSAFLEATLRDRSEYLPLFRDHRVAGDWLPPTMYVTRYREESFRALADFEDDIDVTSGSADGVTLEGRGLGTWREGRLPLRSSNRPTTSSSQDNQAVWLGWAAGGGRPGVEAATESEPGPDPGPPAPPPVYEILLPDGLAAEWGLGSGSALVLDLAALEERPQTEGAERGAGESAEPVGGAGEEGSRDGGGEEEEELHPPDVTIELVDGEGRSARVGLAAYGPVRFPLEVHILRRRDLEEDRFARLHEILLQTFTLPLADFLAVNPALDVRSLRAARLVFDRTPAGTVVVDDVGFSNPRPAFLEGRVEETPRPR